MNASNNLKDRMINNPSLGKGVWMPYCIQGMSDKPTHSSKLDQVGFCWTNPNSSVRFVTSLWKFKKLVNMNFEVLDQSYIPHNQFGRPCGAWHGLQYQNIRSTSAAVMCDSTRFSSIPGSSIHQPQVVSECDEALPKFASVVTDVWLSVTSNPFMTRDSRTDRG